LSPQIDDEENYGKKIQQQVRLRNTAFAGFSQWCGQVTCRRIEGLRKDTVYHVHVIQNAAQEAKDLEETKARHAAAAVSRVVESHASKGPKPESCSCMQGKQLAWCN